MTKDPCFIDYIHSRSARKSFPTPYSNVIRLILLTIFWIIDVFIVKDKRTGEKKEFVGNDDNTALFKNGAREMEIPRTKAWYIIEGDAKKVK